MAAPASASTGVRASNALSARNACLDALPPRAHDAVASVELGNVFDASELPAADGPVGRLTVDVLQEWLEVGDAIEIVVPSRVACARCEGGGCDACGRSGAFRLSIDEAARTLQLTLPKAPPTPTVVVRLARPFGPSAGIEQLWIEVRGSARASACCRRVVRGALSSRTFAKPGVAIVLLLVLAVVLAALLGVGR